MAREETRSDGNTAGEIRRIVLYKQGLGYVERTFEIHGNATLEIDFDENQMPDLLSSLVVIDKGGGVISGVEYEAPTAYGRALSELLGGRSVDGLESLIEAMRGAEVRAEVDGETLQGRLSGIEKYARHKSDAWRLTLVLRKGEVRTFGVEKLSSLKFLDPSVQADLERYLSLCGEAVRSRRKTLRVHCRGKKKREILMAYTIELPVWKSTHRFVLGDDEGLLQSWAVVDNTTFEDWKDVSMTLVCGVPVAFRYDLYTPVYTRREEMRPETGQAAPAEEAQAVPRAPRADTEAMMDGLDDMACAAPMMSMAPPETPSEWDVDDFATSAAVGIEAGRVGAHFFYNVSHPVSVGAGRSAMIPVVSEKIPAGRVLYWRAGSPVKSPYQALEIENSTPLVLDSGPASVFEKGSFLGNALLGRLEPKQSALVMFALQQGVTIETQTRDQTTRASAVVAKSGLIQIRHWQEEAFVVKAVNNTAEEATLLLDYTVPAGWEVTEPKGEEVEPGKLRYRIPLRPDDETEFAIRLRHMISESVQLSEMDARTLGHYVSCGYITEQQKKQLEAALAKKERMEEAEEEMEEIKAQTDEIAKDQSRIRKNLGTLKGDSPEERRLRADYVARLREQEKELETLREKAEALKKTTAKAKEEFDEALKKIAFENLMS